MKHLIVLSVLVIFCSTAPPCLGSAKVLNAPLGLEVKMGGEITTMFKIQKEYGTSLDRPDWGWNWRSGANSRNDQNFRTRGNMYFYFGEPGQTAWFGYTKIKFDANDPDEADTIMRDDSRTWDNSDYKINMGSAFIMYRPFTINGGRPFGITIGNQTVKATANAAYSNVFIGDFEDDFFMYSVATLKDVPAITLDFRLDADTGVGFTYAKGCGDMSEAGGGLKSDSAENYVGWFEGKRWNIGLNAAFQTVSGHRGPTDTHTTDNGNEVTSYQHKYTHYLLNALASYTIKMDLMTVKPFFGYNRIWGDQSPIIALEEAGFDKREVDADLMTYGLTLEYRIGSIPCKLAFEYSDVNTDDFDGIGGLEKGSLLAGLMAADEDFVTDIAAGLGGTYTWSNYPVAGFSETIFNAGGVDWALHLEHTADISPKIKIGLFYNRLEAQKQRLYDRAYVTQQIRSGLIEKFMAESSVNAATAGGVADVVITAMDAPIGTTDLDAIDGILGSIRHAEWEDTYSYGFFVQYSF